MLDLVLMVTIMWPRYNGDELLQGAKFETYSRLCCTHWSVSHRCCSPLPGWAHWHCRLHLTLHLHPGGRGHWLHQSSPLPQPLAERGRQFNWDIGPLPGQRHHAAGFNCFLIDSPGSYCSSFQLKTSILTPLGTAALASMLTMTLLLPPPLYHPSRLSTKQPIIHLQ